MQMLNILVVVFSNSHSNNITTQNIDDDIETGLLEVFAGGWKINSNIYRKDTETPKFIIDNINIHNSNQLIKILFEQLFKKRCKWLYNICT